MQTKNNRKQILLTAQNFIAAVNGNREYYLSFKKYLTATAHGLLSDWKEKVDESFIGDVVDETISDCWNAINGGVNPSNMRQYLRTALRNALSDGLKINHNKRSLDSFAINDNYKEDTSEFGNKPNPKYGYRDNNTVEDEIKKSDIEKINEQIFNYVKKYYGPQIYRMLQVKYDWGLSDCDKKKLAAIFLQCKTKDNSTTVFLSHELKLSPKEILDKINRYEKKLRVDVQKHIISKERYYDIKTFITEDQLDPSLSSVDPSMEEASRLFCSLVFLQDNVAVEEIHKLHCAEKFSSQLEQIISDITKCDTKNDTSVNNGSRFDGIFDNNKVDYANDFEQKDINYMTNSIKRRRAELPNIFIQHNAYLLVLEKYLQLFEKCWKFADDDGNNKRFAETLHYSGLNFRNIDKTADYLSKLPLRGKPTKKVAKLFFKKICFGKIGRAGELEFACKMHIINGYSAFDLAKGFYLYYEGETNELTFERRFNVKQMIFLDDD